MAGEGPVGLELQGSGWKSHKSLKLLCWFWSRVGSFKGINLLSIPISLRLEDGIGTKNVTGFIGAEKLGKEKKGRQLKCLIIIMCVAVGEHSSRRSRKEGYLLLSGIIHPPCWWVAGSFYPN